MKLKEVCARTGLTKKTIRFYEEKHLISPETHDYNGRNYRDYTEKDVENLLMIASLRKAMFSIEEIHTIQQNPEQIAAVVSEYAERIKTLSNTMRSLAESIDQLDLTKINTISELAKAMEPAAAELPLPSYDCKPRFRYFDALEEPVHPVIKVNYDYSMPNQRVLNQATLSKTRGGGLLILANHFTELRNVMKEPADDLSWKIPARDPLPVYVIQVILTIVITVLSIIMVLYLLHAGYSFPFIDAIWCNGVTVPVLIAAIGVKLLIHGLMAWKKHNDWIRKENQR